MTILSTILYKFTFLSDRLKIEGANVINMDIPATNGVIQVNHENMWGWWLINWSTGRWWFPCRPTMFFLCRLWKVSSSSLALSPSREKQFDILISFVRRSQSIWHSAFCCRSRLTLHDHQTVKNAFMSILFVLYKPLLKFILLLWFDIWYSEIYGTRYLQKKGPIDVNEICQKQGEHFAEPKGCQKWKWKIADRPSTRVWMVKMVWAGSKVEKMFHQSLGASQAGTVLRGGRNGEKRFVGSKNVLAANAGWLCIFWCLQKDPTQWGHWSGAPSVEKECRRLENH